MSEITAEPKPEIWQHTDELGRVLLVKCVGKDGKSYNGFQWPKSGPVDPGKWSMEPNCSSGGLFGWAWGLNLGEGKEPEYSDTWIVFAAPANQVVDIDGKQKTGPAEVLYYGDWFGALQFTARGREQYHKKVAAWSQKHGDGTHSTGYRSASSATGDRSASSATGYRSASSATGDQSASSATGYRSASSATSYQSASSATGYQSASSATGDRSASSATGYRSASSATGYRSASSATGDQSASSATGYRSASSATGDRSASSATGYRSASSATGDRSASSATGDRSASSATGYRSASSATGDQSASSATSDQSASSATGYQSASSATGDRSASSATGYRSASSATGDQSASSATGDRSAAIVTGELSTIEIGPSCVGVAMANEVFWRYRAGAVFIQRWYGDKNDSHPHAVLQSLEGVNDGDLLRVVRGVVQK